MDVDFAELQDIHHTWGQDVWIKAKHAIDPSIILIESLLKSIYFTYAYSQAKEITQEQLTSVESSFKTLSSPPAFYLNDSLQSLHVTEFLARHGYRLTSQDAWMLYNPKHSVKISS